VNLQTSHNPGCVSGTSLYFFLVNTDQNGAGSHEENGRHECSLATDPVPDMAEYNAA
jgi:hypothetical protein